MWLPIIAYKDIQHNTNLGAIKLIEPRRAQHLQLCNFVHSSCRFVIIELMQQLGNKFRKKNDKDLRKNPTEATLVLYGYCPGSTDLWRVDFRFHDSKFLSQCSFCVLIHVSAIVKVFRYFLDYNVLNGKSPPIAGRTSD